MKDKIRVCLVGEDGKMYSVPAEELDEFMERAERISRIRKVKEKIMREKLKKTEEPNKK